MTSHHRSGLIALTALAAVLMAPAAATAAPATATVAAPAQFSIPNTRVESFVSKVNGHRYSIMVALPTDPAPAGGYPVLYVLDGYAYFASATEAVRQNAPNVVVVGVGYPNDQPFFDDVRARHGPPPPMMAQGTPSDIADSTERMYDLSLPASAAVLAGQNLPGMQTQKTTDVGGLDDFLKMIETDVKPRVAAMTKVDASNQVLFGHSLGGLAVVRALFTEPTAYRTFVAASPSIWWADNAVLADEAKFDAAVESGAASPRVLITVGAEESAVPKLPPEMHIDPAKLEALTTKARMVDNARDLTTRLKALHGKPPYEVSDAAVFDHQNHTLSPWPALGRAINFAFAAD